MADDKDPDALAMILIAELHKVGLFDAVNLASISKRLHDADEPDLAHRVEALPFSNAITDPDAMRAGIHLISGGNSDSD